MCMNENSLILSKSEYEQLLAEVRTLQARITELTALRDDLIHHVCPALRAEYEEKIVSLERELIAAQVYLRQLQRTVEILQSQINRQTQPSMEEAEEQARKENQEYEEDLNRKAEEARRFREKWKQSRWSAYDREEQETRNNQKNQSSGDGQEGTGERKKDHTSETGEDAEERNQENDSGDPSSENNGDRDESAEKKETSSQKIKRVYRQIVKRLHPDAHPDATEHEKELLQRAMKAFQDGNLAELEQIWDELSGMDAPEEQFEDTPEGRVKLKELLKKLKNRLFQLEQEIRMIRSDFPYKLKNFLEDPEAVEEKQKELRQSIETVRKMNRKLEAYVEELRAKYQQEGRKE